MSGESSANKLGNKLDKAFEIKKRALEFKKREAKLSHYKEYLRLLASDYNDDDDDDEDEKIEKIKKAKKAYVAEFEKLLEL